jgi:recombination protein RecT
MDNPVAIVCRSIAADEFQVKIKQALPPNVSPDRFTRTALTAIQTNPDVCNADRGSLYNAVVKAAQDGLLPDGREGALVVFRTREGPKVQWMPMLQGIIKRLAQGGVSVDAQLVYEKDEFSQEFGDEASIAHRPPKLGQPRGEIIGVYAIARLSNGLVMREVMSVDDINQVREISRSRDKDGNFVGPWKNWYGEMARKTVLRRLSKRLPILDQSIVSAVQADDELYDLDSPEAPAVVTPQSPAPSNEGEGKTAAGAAPKKRPRALQAVVLQHENVPQGGAEAETEPPFEGDVI